MCSGCFWHTTACGSSCTTLRYRRTFRPRNSPSCTPCEWSTESFPGSFLSPPPERSYVTQLLRSETLEERVRPRPGRHSPRGVKRKRSGYHIVPTITRRPKAVLDPNPRRIRLT